MSQARGERREGLPRRSRGGKAAGQNAAKSGEKREGRVREQRAEGKAPSRKNGRHVRSQ